MAVGCGYSLDSDVSHPFDRPPPARYRPIARVDPSRNGCFFQLMGSHVNRRRKREPNYIGFRLDPTQRARLMQLAESQGITASDWLRSVVDAALDGAGLAGLSSEDQGFAVGFRSGLRIARAQLQQATDAMPESLEEARANFGELVDH